MKKGIIRKTHNNYNTKYTYKSHSLCYGDNGIKASTSGYLSDNNIYFLQRYLLKKIKSIKSKKSIKFWNRLQIHNSVTKLSPESRMGKGKGAVSFRVATIKSGQVLFEFTGVNIRELDKLVTDLKKLFPFSIKVLM